MITVTLLRASHWRTEWARPHPGGLPDSQALQAQAQQQQHGTVSTPAGTPTVPRFSVHVCLSNGCDWHTLLPSLSADDAGHTWPQREKPQMLPCSGSCSSCTMLLPADAQPVPLYNHCSDAATWHYVLHLAPMCVLVPIEGHTTHLWSGACSQEAPPVSRSGCPVAGAQHWAPHTTLPTGHGGTRGLVGIIAI